jgi:hypothetical protein
VLQRIDLFVDLGIHLIVAMADAHGDDAAEEIEVLVAVGIPHVLILGARYDERFLVEVEDAREEEFLVRENDFVFSHELCLGARQKDAFTRV